MPALRNSQTNTKQNRAEKNLCGCGCAFFSIMIGTGVLGLTHKLLLPMLIVGMLVLPVCSVIIRKTGRCKPLLYTVRGIAAALLCLPCIMTMLCIGFSKTPALYRIKRFIYREGVRDIRHSAVLSPEKLPADFSGYLFHTRAQAAAQDYHPDAVLQLYTTDTAWLDAFEAKLAAEAGLIRLEFHAPDAAPYDPEDGEEPEDIRPNHLSAYLYSMMQDADKEQFVWYEPTDETGKPLTYGCALISRKTGLVLVWF